MPKLNVLIVFAGLPDEPHLLVDREEQIIQDSIKSGRYRDIIAVDHLHAPKISDLIRTFILQEFKVIHFSGHGFGKGLLLGDNQGMVNSVPPEDLAELLDGYPVECVILSACYSFAQGKLIAKHVPYTIVVRGTADDEAAIEFFREFYDAIAAGKSYDFAYREGRRAVKLNLPDASFDSRLLKPPSRPASLAPQFQDALEAESDDEEDDAPMAFLRRKQPVSSGIKGSPERPSAEPSPTELSLYAIARANIEENNCVLVGKTYMLQAGISQNRPDDFVSAPFNINIQDPRQPLLFDILVHADGCVALSRGWHYRLHYHPRSPQEQIITCSFQARAAGKGVLIVSFYRERQWLQTIRLEVEGVMQQQANIIRSA